MPRNRQMTREDAARIQSATCRNGDGTVPRGSFAARAMSAGYRNQPQRRQADNPSSCVSLALVTLGLFAGAAAIYLNSDTVADCVVSYVPSL